jgi:hypothetical protein
VRYPCNQIRLHGKLIHLFPHCNLSLCIAHIPIASSLLHRIDPSISSLPLCPKALAIPTTLWRSHPPLPPRVRAPLLLPCHLSCHTTIAELRRCRASWKWWWAWPSVLRWTIFLNGDQLYILQVWPYMYVFQVTHVFLGQFDWISLKEQKKVFQTTRIWTQIEDLKPP